ncbi:hypothetical protein MY5147_007273 [Beauveria neobassiana]
METRLEIFGGREMLGLACFRVQITRSVPPGFGRTVDLDGHGVAQVIADAIDEATAVNPASDKV